MKIPFKLEVNATSILAVAGLGIVAYAVLNRKDILTAAVELRDKILNPITTPIADAIAGIGHDAVQVAGEIELPGGQRISVQDILDAGGSIDSQGVFNWQGVSYQISGPQTDGVYHAVLWYGVF